MVWQEQGRGCIRKPLKKSKYHLGASEDHTAYEAERAGMVMGFICYERRSTLQRRHSMSTTKQ